MTTQHTPACEAADVASGRTAECTCGTEATEAHRPMSEMSLDELIAALERTCDLYDQIQARKEKLPLTTPAGYGRMEPVQKCAPNERDGDLLG